MIIKHFHVINEILYSGDNLLLIFLRGKRTRVGFGRGRHLWFDVSDMMKTELWCH